WCCASTPPRSPPWGCCSGWCSCSRGSTRWGVPAWSPAAGRSGTGSWRSSSSWGGLYGFVRPVNTFFALASVLGLILVFYGAFEIVQGVATRAVNPYWWVNLVTGILLVLLAFWVSGSDRVYALAQRSYLILFWVGFLALFRGFSQIFLAFTVRHAGHDAAAALGDTSPG